MFVPVAKTHTKSQTKTYSVRTEWNNNINTPDALGRCPIHSTHKSKPTSTAAWMMMYGFGAVVCASVNIYDSDKHNYCWIACKSWTHLKRLMNYLNFVNKANYFGYLLTVFGIVRTTGNWNVLFFIVIILFLVSMSKSSLSYESSTISIHF